MGCTEGLCGFGGGEAMAPALPCRLPAEAYLEMRLDVAPAHDEGRRGLSGDNGEDRRPPSRPCGMMSHRTG